MRFRLHNLLLAGCIGFSLAGCSVGDVIKPDLSRLYQFAGSEEHQPPVIIIPGILGSRLKLKSTGEEIWPGSSWNL